MVFDTLKKSLSDFTDKITSPVDTITKVTQDMKKKVIGPDTDLLQVIENTLRYTPYAGEMKKQFTKLGTKINKLKMAATKKKLVLEALQLLQGQTEKEADFTAASTQTIELFQKFEKVIKKGSLPTAYEKGNFVLGTTTLSAADTNTVTALFQESQLEVATLIEQIKKPFFEQYVLPLKQTYDYKTAKNAFHDAWKKAIDGLIDDEYEVSKIQKNLLYTTNELSRQQRLLESAESDKRTGKDDKDTMRRINHAKQRIEVLTQKDIPNGLRSLDAALKKITTDEKQIVDLWKDYTSTYETWAKQLSTRLHENRAATKKVVVSEGKKREAGNKKTTVQLKKLQTVYTKITQACEKDTNYSSVATVQGYLQEDINMHETYTQDTLNILASYALQIEQHHKDLVVYNTLLQDRMTYTYGTQLLEKERVIQLKLLLGIKTRHADLSNSIWHNLLDVENKITVNLKEAISHTKQHADICKQQRKAYETEIGVRSKEVKKYSTALKELRGAERARSYMESWLKSLYMAEVNTTYAKALAALYDGEKEHITNLRKMIKKTTTVLEERKKTLTTLEKNDHPTANEKKELKRIADIVHNAELYVDTLEHHVSTEEEHQRDQKQLVNAYTKIATTQTRRKEFYEKQATTTVTKMKKYTHFKELLIEPKKISGKTI